MATVAFSGCSLTGLQFLPPWSGTIPPYVAMGTAVAAQADIAAVDIAILDDINPSRAAPSVPNFGATVGLGRGLLYVPNRGVLMVRPGDYVCFDSATGWPILISGRSAAGAGWTHA